MSAFVRLQDGDANDVERWLLDSASEDVPGSNARARTLLALGVSAGATALAPGAAHLALRTVSSGGAAKAAGSMTALMLAKWVGTGAAIGAITAACIATATTPGLLGPNSKRASDSTVPVVRAIPQHGSEISRGPAQGDAPRVNPRTSARGANETGRAVDSTEAMNAPVRPLSRETADPPPTGGSVPFVGAPYAVAPPGSASASSASHVLAEVASLDRARAALAAGDARSALVRLFEHEQRFAGGTLEPEAVVLRVRALLQLGQRSDAVDVVNRFLSVHPHGSQSARLRALVGAPAE